MKKTMVLLLACGVAGCAESNAEVMAETAPLANAWATVSLNVTGPAANAEKTKTCIEEAHKVGINVMPGAPVGGTLFLGDGGNRVTINTGDRPLGNWSAAAVCRVALAYTVDLDRYVRVGKVDPNGCNSLGVVQGDDQGYAFFAVSPGSYEAALAALQFNAHNRGANYVVTDLARQVGLNFSINGHAFQCPVNDSAPPGPPPQAPPLAQ